MSEGKTPIGSAVVHVIFLTGMWRGMKGLIRLLEKEAAEKK